MMKRNPRFVLIIAITSLASTILSTIPSMAEGKAKAVKPAAAGRTSTSIPNTILSGTVAPKASLGIDGDFYLDFKSMNFYGPKVSGKWPLPIGLRGPQGATGAPGVMGLDGDDGATGKAGSSSVVAGATGATGAIGSVGPAGPKGETGAAGGSGAPGMMGAAGVAGSQGAAGAAGTSGGQGAQGSQGVQGAPGSKGDTGNVGDAGAKGDKGNTGDTGNAGSKGDTGNAGSKGDTGNAGSKGDTGNAGATGPSSISNYTISTWTLSTASAGTGSDSMGFGNLISGQSYRVTVQGHSANTATTGFFGIELLSSSLSCAKFYGSSINYGQGYVDGAIGNIYTFRIEGTVVASANCSLSVRAIDGSGVTSGADNLVAFSGMAMVQLIGQVG